MSKKTANVKRAEKKVENRRAPHLTMASLRRKTAKGFMRVASTILEAKFFDVEEALRVKERLIEASLAWDVIDTDPIDKLIERINGRLYQIGAPMEPSSVWGRR